VLLREGDACVHYGKPVMFLKVFLRKWLFFSRCFPKNTVCSPRKW
jgi:hypothetical protein